MSAEEDNKIVKPVKMNQMFPKLGIRGVGDAVKAKLENIKIEELKNRLVIGFDDSGSMSGSSIADAKKAVNGFLASCNPTETAVGIYPFCKFAKPMTNDYDLVNMFVQGLPATGGTPIYTKMIEMLEKETMTRGILFSDGGATDDNFDAEIWKEQKSIQEPTRTFVQALQKALGKKVPFDTVYIGGGDSEELQAIAEITGGIYLKFDETTTFAKQMKYLSPKYIGLLANADIKARVERGESI